MNENTLIPLTRETHECFLGIEFPESALEGVIKAGAFEATIIVDRLGIEVHKHHEFDEPDEAWALRFPRPVEITLVRVVAEFLTHLLVYNNGVDAAIHLESAVIIAVHRRP